MSYFTALSVPREVVTQLKPLCPVIEGATYMHEDDYHLTLKYLAEPTPDVLESFLTTIRKIPTPPLTINLTRLHVFTRPDLSFLIALTEVTPKLHALHLVHESAAVTLGIPPHAFAEFLPHITLASFPTETAPDLSPILKPLSQSYTTNAVTLYKSNRPHNSGVGRYQPIEHISAYL